MKIAILDDYTALCIMLNLLLSRSFRTIMLRNITYSHHL